VGGVPVIVATSAGLMGLAPISKTSKLPVLDTKSKDLLSCVTSMCAWNVAALASALRGTTVIALLCILKMTKLPVFASLA